MTTLAGGRTIFLQSQTCFGYRIAEHKSDQTGEWTSDGFFVNEKCAAGSGLFLANVLNMLGKRFDSIDLTRAKEPEMRLSSKCAVFAQSEIVEIIAKSSPESKKIVEAVIWQIFKKAVPLLDKVTGDSILLSGGFSIIKGVAAFMSLALGKTVTAAPANRYFSAIGAAII